MTAYILGIIVLLLSSCNSKKTIATTDKPVDEITYTEQKYENISFRIPDTWRQIEIENGINYKSNDQNISVSVTLTDADLSIGIDSYYSKIGTLFTEANGYFDVENENTTIDKAQALKINCYMDGNGNNYKFSTNKQFKEIYIFPCKTDQICLIEFTWVTEDNAYSNIIETVVSSIDMIDNYETATSSEENDNSMQEEESNTGITESTISISDEELLVSQDHPKLTDDLEEAIKFWKGDNRVWIKDGNVTEQSSEDPIIYIETRGTSYKGYSEYKLNEIDQIELYFENCDKGAYRISLEEALLIIAEYMPLEQMKDEYIIDNSVYWKNEDGLTNYQITYRAVDSTNDIIIQRFPDTIAVIVAVDESNSVKWSRISSIGSNYYGYEYHDWDFDFLNNNKEKKEMPQQKEHYDETLEGRGRADDGWDEPEYIGVIGYAVISATQAHAIENNENFEDTGIWVVPTYEKDKQLWNEISFIPHKTEVVVREQILHHEGHGFYSGYLLVETTNDKTKHYIDVDNFVTKPYWTYQTDLHEAAMIGDFVAQYKQVSDYYPVDSGGKKLEIPEGTIVLVTGVTSSSSLYNIDETGIEAVVWKEWANGYGGVKCHFNENDLIIVD